MSKNCKGLTQGGKEYQLNYITKVDWKKCTGCGSCVKICGVNVLQMVNTTQGLKAKVISPNNCLGEGHCLKGCHAKALVFKNSEINDGV